MTTDLQEQSRSRYTARLQTYTTPGIDERLRAHSATSRKSRAQIISEALDSALPSLAALAARMQQAATAEDGV